MVKELLKRSQIYKKVLKTTEGQAFLKYIGIEAGLNQTSYTLGDSHQTAFNEGKRQIILHILGVLDQDEALLRRAIQHEAEQKTLENWNGI